MNKAVIFTGQGAQRNEMAKDFYEAYSVSKESFETASKAIDISVEDLCFNDDERLKLTAYTQPGMLTAEIAIFEAIKEEYKWEPTVFAGHSLGEYTALVAAGVIPLSAAVKIVHKRGSLMQDAVAEGKGAMAALIYDDVLNDKYISIITESGAEVANFNSLKQLVISGEKEKVENASKALAEACPDMRIIPLNVSAPFHCSLMTVIEEEFKSYISSFQSEFNYENVGKVFSNFTGKYHSQDTLIDSLVKQISGSVRWVENMKSLARDAEKIVEVGPSRVLSKFFDGIETTEPVKSVSNIRTAEKCFNS